MRLKITREGSLLSTIIDQEVTEAQANSVIALLKDEALTYGDVLAFLVARRMGKLAIDYDAPVGAGESVEAFRG